MAGSDQAMGRVELAAQLKRRLNVTWWVTIAVGALLVFVFVAFLAPIEVDPDEENRLRALSAIVGAAERRDLARLLPHTHNHRSAACRSASRSQRRVTDLTPAVRRGHPGASGYEGRSPRR